MAYCEDYPCCGHEAGDCDGSLYGSDESIKARVMEDIRNGHGDCDHQDGIYNCEGDEDELPPLQPSMEISDRWYPR